MRRIAIFFLLGVLAACTSDAPKATRTPVAGPISFRVLREAHNARACVDPPDSAIALDEDGWINVFDRQTACLPSPEITLPRVRFGSEVGLAIWWDRATCRASAVKTIAVERAGEEVVVRATTSAAATCPATLGALESFLALERSNLYDGSQRLVLELDGEPVAP